MFKQATKQSSNPANSGATTPVLETGGYPACLRQVIDLGLQPGYRADEDPKHKLEIKFELMDEFRVDENGKELTDQPVMVSMDVTYNPDGYMHEKSKLYGIVSALDAFEVSPREWLGKFITVSLLRKKRATPVDAANPESDKNYRNQATGITPMRAKDLAKQGDPVTEELYFDLDTGDLEIFKKLPDAGQWCARTSILKSLDLQNSPLWEKLSAEDKAPAAAKKAPEAVPQAFDEHMPEPDSLMAPSNAPQDDLEDESADPFA